MYYRLKGKYAEKCSLMEFAYDHMYGHKQIVRDRIGRILVSTIFLHIDHSCGFGKSLLFETMVFTHGVEALDSMSDICVQYSTYAEAKKGHGEILHRVYELLGVNTNWK